MTEMMKAAIFVEPGKMAVEEVPKATLEQNQAEEMVSGMTC